MNCAVISFTKNGADLNRMLCRGLVQKGHSCEGTAFGRFGDRSELLTPSESLREWTGRMFREKDALLFVSASGIAVRSIAPFIRDKKTDPAVLVIDEQGKYVISLLSGHLGGANALATAAAAILGAEPVITTATDRQGKFAVDVFAKNNGLAILEMDLAREVSSRIVNQERVGLKSDFPIAGTVPAELTLLSGRDQEKNPQDTQNLPETGICISLSGTKAPFPRTLHLVPRIVTAGIGCRRGAEPETIFRVLRRALDEADISEHALCRIASIDKKAEEKGILTLACELGIPFETFSADELSAVSGTFTPSAFVQNTVGVDNVCERSAVLAGGRLIKRKQAEEGVTAALAVGEWRAEF